MKNKPIKEGYKFFVLACSLTGFILNFTPCGANPNSDTDANEYCDKENGKILSVILFLIKMLVNPTRTGRKFIVNGQ